MSYLSLSSDHRCSPAQVAVPCIFIFPGKSILNIPDSSFINLLNISLLTKYLVLYTVTVLEKKGRKEKDRVFRLSTGYTVPCLFQPPLQLVVLGNELRMCNLAEISGRLGNSHSLSLPWIWQSQKLHSEMIMSQH